MMAWHGNDFRCRCTSWCWKHKQFKLNYKTQSDATTNEYIILHPFHYKQTHHRSDSKLLRYILVINRTRNRFHRDPKMIFVEKRNWSLKLTFKRAHMEHPESIDHAHKDNDVQAGIILSPKENENCSQQMTCLVCIA